MMRQCSRINASHLDLTMPHLHAGAGPDFMGVDADVLGTFFSIPAAAEASASALKDPFYCMDFKELIRPCGHLTEPKRSDPGHRGVHHSMLLIVPLSITACAQHHWCNPSLSSSGAGGAPLHGCSANELCSHQPFMVDSTG